MNGAGFVVGFELGVVTGATAMFLLALVTWLRLRKK